MRYLVFKFLIFYLVVLDNIFLPLYLYTSEMLQDTRPSPPSFQPINLKKKVESFLSILVRLDFSKAPIRKRYVIVASLIFEWMEGNGGTLFLALD